MLQPINMTNPVYVISKSILLCIGYKNKVKAIPQVEGFIVCEIATLCKSRLLEYTVPISVNLSVLIRYGVLAINKNSIINRLVTAHQLYLICWRFDTQTNPITDTKTDPIIRTSIHGIPNCF